MNEEFLINSYLKKLSKNNPSSLNLNDDVFFDKNKRLVISVDAYNEGIHFLNFNKPDLVIRKRQHIRKFVFQYLYSNYSKLNCKIKLLDLIHLR